jgi:hypothetical protein
MTLWLNANATKPLEVTMADTVAPAAPSPTPSPAPPPAAPLAAPPPAPASSVERITDAHYDNLPVDQQSRYARVRAGLDGGSVWQARRDLTPDGKPPAPATAPASDSQARFVDGKLVLGDLELSAAEARELMQAKADKLMRQTQMPNGPEGYQPVLSPTFRPPEGAEITFDTNDGAYRDLQRVAHRIGLSQTDFSDLLTVYAAKTTAEAVALRTAINREIAALGVNGQQRITALQTWMRSAVGDDLARALSQSLVTAEHVEAFERLAARDMSGGAASFSQAHREPAQGNGKVSDEEYNRMSPAQRWAYSRSFDQKQFK